MPAWLRLRLPWLVALVLVVPAGLAVRYGAARVPFLAKYGGVALWSVMAYAAILVLAPRLSVARAALIALAVSFAVELAQLSPIPAALSAKHLVLRLLLGTTFSVYDLPAYAVGVALAAAAHHATARSALAGAVLLTPLLLVWTLPQTLAGLAFAIVRRAQGHPARLYLFGPFLFLVIPAPGPWSAGISLGLVVLACREEILKHECCHLLTGLWLSWLYLPVYGLEYLLVGHDRSPHEQITCRFERSVTWSPDRVRRRS
jgi:hypothetical protein